MASKEANRLKYRYSKKYVEAYWERKARQQKNGETTTKKTRKTKTVSQTISCFDDDLQPEMADVEITVCRNGKSDERYIKALELANKRLNGENNRLIRLMIKYKNLIRQITELYYGEE